MLTDTWLREISGSEKTGEETMIERVGFISDTHGSLPDTKRAMEILAPVQLWVHCGDVLYHGPRNKIPEGYTPADLAEFLSYIREDQLLYVRGNCDADVDEQVIGRPLSYDRRIIDIGSFRILALHGFLESEAERVRLAQDLAADLLVSGHTHRAVLKEEGGIAVLNPGSTTLPKDDAASAAVLDLRSGEIQVRSLDDSRVLMNLYLRPQDKRPQSKDEANSLPGYIYYSNAARYSGRQD